VSETVPLAAEYVLRLIEGEELMAARRRVTEDSAFAAEVEWWEERLAPLLDEFVNEVPSPELWQRILDRIEQPGGEIVTLKRKLARWRSTAAITALAAMVLLGLQLRADPPLPAPAPQVQVAPLLLASLAGEEAPEALTVAYRPDTRELVITPARIQAPASRARQLWLIPAGGQPISLGLVASEGVQRRQVTSEVGTNFVSGATIAVSDEPTGGSPTGQPTGAVLASGSLADV
jgi:anti-sigma-K factor RskA